MRTFPGLKHRQELVATVGKVAFVNDSKATNADAAEKALLCYQNIYWIAGGRAKEGGIAALAPLFNRIRHAFLIGEAADDFADTLEGHVPIALYEDMGSAIEEAGDMALKDKLPGATVLLSPACASFDMFKNFEERGDRFRAEVLALWPQKNQNKRSPHDNGDAPHHHPHGHLVPSAAGGGRSTNGCWSRSPCWSSSAFSSISRPGRRPRCVSAPMPSTSCASK